MTIGGPRRRGKDPPFSASLGDDERDRPGIESVLLPALFDSTAVALIAVDPDGTITAVSPSAEAMLAWAGPDLVGLPLHQTLHSQRPDGTPLPESECPMAEALSDGRAAEGHGEVLLRGDGTLVEISWAVSPIILAGWRTGGVVAFFDPAEAAAIASRELVRVTAMHSANARLSLLADATHILVSTSDLRAGLTEFARLLVPTLADWVVIDLADPESGRLERAALVHRNPRLEALGLSKLGTLPPIAPDMHGPLARVLRGGPTERISEFPPVESAADDLARVRLELFHHLGCGDALTAPLRTRRQTIGALTLVRSGRRRLYRTEDIALVTELAGRVAFVVENSWLVERQQRRAEDMQRALLPSLPDIIQGIELTGVYCPADDLSRVGGDWYDAFPLPDGTVAVVIGDVAGHDVHAAGRMGAIRNKLRAIAGDRMAPPSEVLFRLDTVLRNFAPDDLATLIYGRLRHTGSQWTVEMSNAGHPQPVRLGCAGRPVDLIRGPVDPPIGVGPVERRDHRVELDPGSQLIFYTDGLIERTDQTLAAGLDRLVEVASRLDAPGIAGRCQGLVDLMDVEGRDDVALLGVAVPPG